MKLFFRHFGSGPPVVILHGLFGLSDNWVTFGRQLGEHYSVYIPDLRNHGQSPHSGVFDFPSLEQDVDEFAGDHGLEKFFLIGHSLGGKTAMLYTLHNPGRVAGLTVVDISLRKTPPGRDHQHLLDAMLGVDLAAAGSRGEIERQLSASVPDERVRQFLMKNVYWRDRHRLDWRPDLRSINENLPAIFEAIDVPESYAGSALFIRGGRSDYVSDADIEALKSRFPGAAVKTIANASHWVHADAPGEFFGMVKDFLDAVVSSG